MQYMFEKASELSNLDTSSWTTDKVTNMQWMFSNCVSLTGLDLSKWNTSMVTSMQALFQNCSRLETIYTSTTFVTDRVTSSNFMFKDTNSLI